MDKKCDEKHNNQYRVKCSIFAGDFYRETKLTTLDDVLRDMTQKKQVKLKKVFFELSEISKMTQISVCFDLNVKINVTIEFYTPKLVYKRKYC